MVTTTPPIRWTGLATSLKNELNQEGADMDTIFGIIYAVVTTLMVFVAGLSLALAWEMWRERKNKRRND